MRLYNTITKKIEEFIPLDPPKVRLYTCGPTVYDYVQIGNMRTFVSNDVLRRVLVYNDYEVRHVMNITDVGHLTGDTDTGEDKLEKGAKKQKKSVWKVAQYFTDYFFRTADQLNILRPDVVCRATEHISAMIDLITRLQTNHLTYETDQAVYFNTEVFKKYGVLTTQNKDEKLVGARAEIVVDPAKKNPADFAVWFKRVGRFADHVMHWDSPWGDGFPGWHIECSAMSMKYLGDTLDIHAGGIDLIPVHHENEIAQSEGATEKPFVRYWFHSEFLLVEGEKMSKSLNNFYTIEDIKKKGIHPLALRYLFLQSHYRTQMNFTWDALSSAYIGYKRLLDTVSILKKQTQRQSLSEEKLHDLDSYRLRFNEALSNDLQTPVAISVMHELIKSNIPSNDKYELLLEFDRVLGLSLASVVDEKIPDEVIFLAEQRKKAREKKEFDHADTLRKKIEKLGYNIKDKNNEYFVKKTSKI